MTRNSCYSDKRLVVCRPVESNTVHLVATGFTVALCGVVATVKVRTRIPLCEVCRRYRQHWIKFQQNPGDPLHGER